MSNTKIYDVLSGLHSNDVKINDKVNSILTGIIGLSSVTDETFAGNSIIKNGKINTDVIQVTQTSYASIEDTAGHKSEKVQFIGDCKVSYKSDGSIVIRIGENLNSSNYNTTDGKTTGTANITVPTATAAYLPDGTPVSLLKATGSYSSLTTGKIHFPDNTGTTFEVTVTDDDTAKTYYFGPVTGDATYTAKDAASDGNDVTGVTLTVTNFDDETNSSQGATGYCGNVKFTIAASAIAGSDSSSIAITKISCKNTEGTFDYTPLNTSRWYETDTTTKPSVTGGSVSFENSGTTTVSGVKYVNAPKMIVNVAGDNFKTPAYITSCGSITGTGFSKVSLGTGNLISDESLSAKFDLNSGMYTCDSVKVTVSNVNGSSTETSIDIDPDQKILKVSSVGSISEANRLKPDLTAWDSTVSLADNEGLQISGGVLLYPTVDYSNCNSIFSITDQPDYSNINGARSYIQKFTKAGTISSGDVTLTSIDSTDGVCGNTFDVYVWNGTSSNGWKNISKVADGYIASAVSYGTTTKLTFSMNQGADYGAGFIYVKVVYKQGCTAKITNIQFA